MFSWLSKWMPPKVGPTSYRVVEITPAQRLGIQRTDKEIQESVATLQAHPGFIYLMQRLDIQNAALKAKLVGERHDNLSAVQFLQAGIFWSNWLRQEIARATARPIDRTKDAYEEELEAFKEIDSLLERVGE